MEGEGGGEDEGGERDAVGHQDEGEEPPSTWSDFAKLRGADGLQCNVHFAINQSFVVVYIFLVSFFIYREL